MYAKLFSKSFVVLLMASVVLAGAALSGCGKDKAEATKAESAQIHAPLGQSMPPEARAAMEKAMQKRGGTPPGPAAPK